MTQQHITEDSIVLCPICKRGKIIIEEKDADDVPLQLILPGSKRKARWYIKCNVCKSQIGITVKKQ
ncbi:MAG: hypothetical protein A2Y17_13550 [Clostridiales bacterium GWF2_38_85]|nr:MAG: hypothetical protein A2Y17_13550 [Clostridiales bacterium GWF2_38_85]